MQQVEALPHHSIEPPALPKPRLALLVNTLAPYRLPIYRILAKQFELAVFHGGREGNRTTWRKLEDQIPEASVKQSKGLQVRYARRREGKKIDDAYLHLNFGFFADLVRWRPEAVISNEMGLRTLLALAYGALWKRPVWVWWGGTLHTERSASFVRRCIRWSMARIVRHWISYGQSSTEYLESIGVNRDRILQIQNSVDEQMFVTPATPFEVEGPPPVILHVGQFIARKGIDHLLHSAARLQRAGYSFTLLLVGNGPERDALHALARELKLKDVIFEAGKLPKEMPSIYRAADCLIFPTLEDVWGLVANEALLSGIPVVCSKYAGCAREIIPEENIFDPLDDADFDRILTSVLEARIEPADTRVLRTSSQNAHLIVANVSKMLDEGL